ncbi:MAG: sulfur carrier protein ThiS [Candidatus Cloacimonetes bacterium]|nr:sulfur carrier protein ThiS [Candidatus Cloacimonadota bacterium]MDD2506713.1 sulfur carrier protein ThiS [Candidatus Cloacimonadota bacterium]MDD4560304.1 sulfur carrier protein ThiS [Candidatus Cloacimonadota bacterium]
MNTSIKINGNIVDWQEGMTVRDALKVMNYTFPMLVIRINGKLVPKSDYDSTEIPVGAEVKIIHLISGG